MCSMLATVPEKERYKQKICAVQIIEILRVFARFLGDGHVEELTHVGHCDGLLDQTRVALAATNLADKPPPFFNGASGYYGNGFNPFGRTFNLSVSKRF